MTTRFFQVRFGSSFVYARFGSYEHGLEVRLLKRGFVRFNWGVASWGLKW